jgi:autotransporter-associated beta strand protein
LAVSLSLLAASATANIFLDLQVDPSSPHYQAATPRSITFNNAQASDTFILDCYALITPNGTNVATPSNEGISSMASNFFVASSVLKGDVSFGSWATSGPGQIGTTASVTGFHYVTTYGGLGLGGTATNDNTQSHWWIADTVSIPATGGTPLINSSGTVGIEYFLGTITVSFSSYVLPPMQTTAIMGAVPDYGTALNKKYNWLQDGTATGSLMGNNALVAFGTNSTSLLYSSTAQGISGMSFTFAGSNLFPPRADLSALSLTGSRVMAGGSLSATASLTNTYYASGGTQDSLATWTVGGSGSFTAQSGTNLAASSSVAVGPLTYTAGATTGLTSITLLSSGTGASTAAVVSGSSGSTIAVLNQRVVTASPILFGVGGRFMASQSLSGSSTLSTSGGDNNVTRVTVNGTLFNSAVSTGTYNLAPASYPPGPVSIAPVTLPVTTAENGGAGLSGEGSYAGVIVSGSGNSLLPRTVTAGALITLGSGGRFMAGQTVGGVTSLSTTGGDDTYTRVTANGTLFNSATTSSNYSLSTSFPAGTVPPIVLPVTTAENGGAGLPGEPTYAGVLVSNGGNALLNRTVTVPSSNFATIHLGQSISQSILLSSTGGDNQYTRVTIGNTGSDANGISVNGGSGPIFNGPGVSDTRALSGTPNAPGLISGTVTLPTTSEGLPGESPISVPVNYSVAVFSGSGMWSAAGGGSWGVNANWNDAASAGVHAAPGTWGVAGDTATFASGGGTVTLDGASPSVASITFNSTTGSFTLASGSGGTLHLNGFVSAALTDAGGSHTIAAPLAFDSAANATVNNVSDTLTISGPISGVGTLTKNGLGTLTVAGNGSYTGGTTVQQGSLNVTGTLGGGGNVQIAAGANLSGSGVVTGNITGAAGSAIVATGNLSLGDSTSFAGFNHAGTLTVGGNCVTLNSAGFANIGVLTTLAGGTLSAPNGVSLGVGCNLSGSGTVQGKIAAGYGSTINATGNLTLGDATSPVGFISNGELYTHSYTVTLNSANAAGNKNAVVLGSLTQIDGGDLAAPNGVLLNNGYNMISTDAGGSVSGGTAAQFLNRGNVQGPSSASANWLTFNLPFKGSTGQTFGRIAFLGGFATGDSPGVNTQHGAALLGGAGTVFDIGGTTAGTGNGSYGQLNVVTNPNDANDHGNLMLAAGTSFKIVDWNGFVPIVGETFTVLTWDGSLSGTASLAVDPAFAADGLNIIPQWNSNSLTLQAVRPASVALSAAGATIITGGTATLAATVSNVAISPAASLNYSLAAAGGGAVTLGTPSPASGTLAPSASQTSSVAATSTNLGNNFVVWTASDPNSTNLADSTTATLTVLGHAAPALAVTSGNSQRVIVGASGAVAGLSLSNGRAGQGGLASLDVNSLGDGVIGPTGGQIVSSGTAIAYAALLTANTSGPQTETFSLNAGDDHALPGASPPSQVSTGIALTGVANRRVTAMTANFGVVHAGSVLSQSITLSTSGDDNYFTRVSVGNAGPDANGMSVSGGMNPTFNAASVTDTRTLAGVINSVGTVNGSITLHTTGEGLAGEVPIDVPVNYTAQIYSGKAQWNATTGLWGTASNWTDSLGGGPSGVPGVQGFPTDTATFGSSVDIGTAVVVLNGVSPTLSAMTFDNAGASFWILQGAGTTGMTLTGTDSTSPARLEVASGSHLIQAGITMASNLDVSSSGSLELSGRVADNGLAKSITLDGSGDLILSGTGTYTGGTFVDSGTLVVTNPRAIQSGTSLTIGEAAAIEFTPPASIANVAVPEPGTIILAAFGVLASTYCRFRRKALFSH